jgi:hypothetical protein
MKGLKQNTERFCRDPVNVMTEKHFLVKSSITAGHRGAHRIPVGAQRPGQLAEECADADLQQLKEHQTLLERRVENLKKLSGTLSSLQERLHQLETQKMALGNKSRICCASSTRSLGTADRQRVAKAKAA